MPVALKDMHQPKPEKIQILYQELTFLELCYQKFLYNKSKIFRVIMKTMEHLYSGVVYIINK